MACHLSAPVWKPDCAARGPDSPGILCVASGASVIIAGAGASQEFPGESLDAPTNDANGDIAKAVTEQSDYGEQDQHGRLMMLGVSGEIKAG